MDKEKYWEKFFLFRDYVMHLKNGYRNIETADDAVAIEKERIALHKAIADYYGVVKDDLNGALHNIDLNQEAADRHLMETVESLIRDGLVRKI
jgi:hypothetical protein